MKRLLLVMLLIACKNKPADDQPKPPPPTTTAPVTADAAAQPAPDAAMAVNDAPAADPAAAPAVPSAPPGALDARADGVGPITEKTRIDLKALKAAFPGYEVKKVSRKMGDGDLREDYVGISKGGKLILKLAGDEFLRSVDIMSDDVWNPWGITLGMTGAELEKRVGAIDCSDAGEATDWRAHLAECDGAKADHYQFDLEGDGANGKQVAEDPAKRAAAKLVAIRWVVPGNGPPGAE